MTQGKAFDPDFREACVRLVRAGGRSQGEFAADLGVSTRQLRRWIRQAEVDEGKRPGLTHAEQRELGRLRRENAALREQIVIHKKFQAFLEEETRRTESGSSRGKRNATK